MSDNFNELKRLFNAECESEAQDYIEALLKEAGVSSIDEYKKVRPHSADTIEPYCNNSAKTIILAKLLDGYTFRAAARFLRDAAAWLDDTARERTFNADDF